MMAKGILFAGEADGFHGGDNENIAYDGHDSCRCCRGQSEGADLGSVSGQEGDIGDKRQRTVGIPGNDDDRERGVESVGELDEINDFAGFSRIGDEQKDIVGLKNAEIAVLGFAGV